MAVRVCAGNPVNGEFTLCGDAFDAFATGDADEEHVQAEKGQTITCDKCCAVILDVRQMRYRLKPRVEE
ncbi:hypothetical protein [Pseudomonas chlororaphis]